MENVRSRGRPRSAAPLSAAERMRRYRARLRARGLRRVEMRRRDPLVAALRVPAGSFLTPGEKEVLRRFCSGLAALPALPAQLRLFGSRARGDADEHSDLDVAVLFDGGRDRAVESELARLAFEARAPYCSGAYAIRLRPVALFAREALAEPLRRTLAAEGQTIWTRPK
jgi:hypothetical protein